MRSSLLLSAYVELLLFYVIVPPLEIRTDTFLKEADRFFLKNVLLNT